MKKKSYAVVTLLTILFGPFGIMYASIGAGFAYLFLELAIIFIAAMASPDAGALAFWIVLFANPVFGWMAAKDRNDQIELEKQEEEERMIRLAEAIRGGADIKELVGTRQ